MGARRPLLPRCTGPRSGRREAMGAVRARPKAGGKSVRGGVGVSTFGRAEPVISRGRSWMPRLRHPVRRGNAGERRESWRERERAYGAMLALDPSLTHIWVQYGHALKEQGRLSAAEQAY